MGTNPVLLEGNTLIFNNIKHAIEADNFNYTVIFNVENYSQRADNINFK